MKLANAEIDLPNFALLLSDHIEAAYAIDGCGTLPDGAIEDFFKDTKVRYLKYIATERLKRFYEEYEEDSFVCLTYQELTEQTYFEEIYHKTAEAFFNAHSDLTLVK